MLNNLAAADTSEGSIINPVLPSPIGNSQDPVNYLRDHASPIMTLFLIVGVLIFLFNLITGAIQWISSGGEKQSIESARGKITNAIIGLVILFAVFAIIGLIENFMKIEILTLDISKVFPQ